MQLTRLADRGDDIVGRCLGLSARHIERRGLLIQRVANKRLALKPANTRIFAFRIKSRAPETTAVLGADVLGFFHFIRHVLTRQQRCFG
jgi:hypothetical protein